MKKKKNKKKTILKKYNDANAKKNLKVTGMKTGVDLIAGVGVGTLAGSAMGSLSPFIGLLLMGIGHFAGDQSGVLRIAGASITAYGIASAVENRNMAKATTINGVSLGSLTEGTKTRLLKLKENWKHGFYLDKIGNKKKDDTSIEKTIGAIDMEALNNFENMVNRSAVRYQANSIQQEDNHLLKSTQPMTFEDETGTMLTISPSLDGHFLEDDQEFDFSTM